MYLQIHQHFSHCVLLAVLLGLTMDVTSGMGSITLIPQYPVINGSVTLSVTGIIGTLEAASWFKGPDTDPPYQILAYYPASSNLSPLIPGTLYNSRFLPFNNGSLQIKDLLLTDGGNYIVKIVTEKGQQDISVTLTVYEPVTKPKITASIPQPKENGTFTLMCDTSHATTILWTMRGTSISSQIQLSGGNKTLTFSSIKQGDSGEYQCEAQNLVSRKSSDPYTVTVAYGPDNVKIEGTSFVNPGSPITLSCSAKSFPTPEYQWKLNGTILVEKTNKYGISSAMHENEGLYTCMVTNTVTQRSDTASIYVNVTAEYVAPQSSGTDLSMIIGIVVALLLLLLLIAAISYLFMIHKRRKNSNDSNSNMKDSSRNGQADIPTQSGEQHELQYASIEFSKNMPKKEQKPEVIYENRTSPAAPPPTENVVYSELKLR